MDTTKLEIGIDPLKPVVAEERAGVIDMHPLPRLRRLLPLPKCWRIWISTVYVASLAVVDGLVDRRIDSGPPQITANQLLTARTVNLRNVKQLKHPTAKQLRYHNAYSPQQYVRFNCKCRDASTMAETAVLDSQKPSTLYELDNARKNRVVPWCLPN